MSTEILHEIVKSISALAWPWFVYKIFNMADSTLKCTPLSSKKKREAGDAKPKHFLGLVLSF